jgi:hypothetical protein
MQHTHCPHCGNPTKGQINGYCSWDCHDHAGDTEPERKAA